MRAVHRCPLVLLILVGTTTACRHAAGPTTLVPVVRVLDILHVSPRPGLLHGGDVGLDRVTHRVVASPAVSATTAVLEGDGSARHYRLAALPDVVRTWGGAQLLRRATLARGVTMDVPTWVSATGPAPTTLPVVATERPAEVVGVGIRALLPGRSTVVETAAFPVPPDAVLTFDVGVQAASVRRAIPIPARVTVLDGGTAHVVWRAAPSGASTGWHGERISLAAFAGRRIRLRFAVRHEVGAAFGLLPVFGEPLVLAPRPRAALPFDVVLVSMDALRARSLGAYGCERATSPTLDALGADGVLFENAFSTAAFTLPGHMSMLTGLWFRTHEAIVITSVLSPEHRTLAEVLQAAGYATGAFTSGAWIVPWAGFRRGFDEYYEMTGDTQSPTDEPFRRGLAWMRAHVDQPFFVFLHDYVVHAAYTPPPPYAGMFDPLPADAPEAERKRLAYEQEVRYGDDQIRSLLEGLAALGVADRTLVIVTADHGEAFGEHGIFEHTYDVHDEVAHVPLVMRLPGAIPAGVRIAEPVSLADVVPTVVDLLGVPPVAGVDGASLAPLIEGTASRLPRGGVFTEAASGPDVTWTDLVAVHTRATSCIHDGRRGTQECYDRRSDPWQVLAPLPADDGSAAVAEAKALLARFEASKPPAGTPHEQATAPPAGGLDDVAPMPGEAAERRERLRALGYVQ